MGIWSTKGFVARWSGPAPASGTIVDVDLQTVGTDRLAGTITNRMPVALKDTIVAFGKQVYYDVGTIERNHEAFVNDGTVMRSADVDALLADHDAAVPPPR